jgi:hypothetical protein
MKKEIAFAVQLDEVKNNFEAAYKKIKEKETDEGFTIVGAKLKKSASGGYYVAVVLEKAFSFD